MDAATLGAVKPRPPSTPSDWLEEIRRRNIERAVADAQLPLWPEPVRGVPNGVLRSALFGAIKRGKRRYMEREPIASVEGVAIIYTGPRLDQSDLDVWEGALHLARLVNLGDRIEFTEKGFLRLIGRGGLCGENIGKSDREWLKKVFSRLSATTVEIKQGPYAYGGSLIEEYFRDEGKGRYVVILNPRMKVVFNRDSWTQVDWNIRHALLGHPLAQWLHGFYSTHAAPFPIKFETLHRLCGSETGDGAKTEAERHKALLGWRDDSLAPALKALAVVSNQAGQRFAWEISGGGVVSVSRNPSTSQRKHLRAKAAKPHKAGTDALL
ncbi:MAG: plasmid replication initiator TrfA [Gallionellaceae bacterium]|nr:plasmid replication initiator TrfA [Gallionellaceae bacterium]